MTRKTLNILGFRSGDHMTRNYQLGSRCMYQAGKFALKNAANKKFISFQTAADIAARWRLFCQFAADAGVRQMEFVTEDLVLQYGIMLAKKARDPLQAKTKNDGLLAISTAQNRVSAVNTVMTYATSGEWRSVSPTAKSSCDTNKEANISTIPTCAKLRSVSTQTKRGCGIKKRSNIRITPPSGLDRQQLQECMSGFDMNQTALVMLTRDLGLRSKEASLLDSEIALDQALRNSYVDIVKGTKGGRPRRINITSSQQIESLQYAVNAQGDRRNLITDNTSWKNWREGALREIREALQAEDVRKVHDLRAAYACDRYKMLTGYDAPILGGKAPKALDRRARLIIAEELGHGRIDVTNSYLGSLT